ncbi:SAM-dependent methyltransferase [Actinomycetes bacterium KLBMP 9797]
MRRPDWAPESIDIERPSGARMYDYYLGGSHNFAVDRAAAQAMIAALPEIPLMAQANRAFLRRAVRYLVDAGIRQFLDLGSGIPTVGNVHEIAQGMAPDARVVYVDIDPVAVAHSRHLLGRNDRAVAIQEDIRHPERILDYPDVRKLIDFDEPVAVLVVSVLHYIAEGDRPADILAALRRHLVPGSYLVLSHACVEGGTAEELAEVTAIYDRTDSPLKYRPRSEVAGYFAGYELVPPGLVWVPTWRPDESGGAERVERTVHFGGVGRLL